MSKYFRYFLYFFCVLIIFISLKNISITALKFYSSNIAIRLTFLDNNELQNNGTHDGGKKYWQKVMNIAKTTLNFDFSEERQTYTKISRINPNQSNFKHEYQIINILFDLSKISKESKKETLIYIPKSLKEYWEMSCDTHMTPFIATSIANIAMIEGLPFFKKQSCYGHKLEYGYNEYFKQDKFASDYDLSIEQICTKAKKINFSKIIELKKRKEKIVKITHNCT